MHRNRFRVESSCVPALLISALVGLLAAGALGQTEPKLTIEEPRDQTDLSTLDVPLSQVPITITWDAPDGVDRIELWVDNERQWPLTDQNEETFERRGSTTYNWQANRHGPGEHVLSIVLFSGQTKVRREVTVRFGTGTTEPAAAHAPELRLASPVSQQVLRDRTSVEAEIVGGQAQWVAFFLDNTHVGAVFAPPFRYTIDTALLPDGVHILRASARMQDGSMLDSAPVRVTFANSGARPGPGPVGPAGPSAPPAGAGPEILNPGGAATPGPETPTAVAAPGPLPIPDLDLLPVLAYPTGDLGAEPTEPTAPDVAPGEPMGAAPAGGPDAEGWAPLKPSIAPADPELAGPEAVGPPPTEPDETAAPPAREDDLPAPDEALPAGPTIAPTADPSIAAVLSAPTAPEVAAPADPEVAGPAPAGAHAPEGPPAPVEAAHPETSPPAGPELAGPQESDGEWRPLDADPPVADTSAPLVPLGPTEPEGRAPAEAATEPVLPLLAGPTVPTLPDQPPTVAIATGAARPVEAAPGTIRIEIDGTPMALSGAPVLSPSNTVLVPLRDFAAREGVVTKWDPTAKRVSGYRGLQLVFSVQAGNGEATILGQVLRFPSAPAIVGETLYVPLGFLGEAFGYRFELDEAASTVRVTAPGGAPVEL